MILRRGDFGSAVVDLQEHLARWGYQLVVDGDFGEATETAVRAFQTAEGLTVDGAAGPATMGALESGPSVDGGARFRALACAIADLGKSESPLGSQGGTEIAHLVDGYRAYWQIDGPRPAWCGLAVCVWTAMALGLGESGAVVDWSRHPSSGGAARRWTGTHSTSRSYCGPRRAGAYCLLTARLQRARSSLCTALARAATRAARRAQSRATAGSCLRTSATRSSAPTATSKTGCGE